MAQTLNYTRQHYYKQKQDLKKRADPKSRVKALVPEQRKLLPRVGGRKTHYLITPYLRLHNLKWGRDKLFTLLRENELLINPRRRYVQTTNSKHWMRKYPNRAKALELTAPEQLWVSDITYLKTQEGHCYLSLVTDAWSRKIMGYAIEDNMEAASSVKALKMALKNRVCNTKGLVHHSDRGLQYGSREYVGVAQAAYIQMSMMENGDPYENALAERMNRTIKEEFCLDHHLKTKQQAYAAVKQAIYLYNTYRPHQALSLKTPNQVHQKAQPPEAVGLI